MLAEFAERLNQHQLLQIVVEGIRWLLNALFQNARRMLLDNALVSKTNRVDISIDQSTPGRN